MAGLSSALTTPPEHGPARPPSCGAAIPSAPHFENLNGSLRTFAIARRRAVPGHRGAAIRRDPIQRGIIKGIVGLPASPWRSTRIPARVLIIARQKPHIRTGNCVTEARMGSLDDGIKSRLRAQDIHQIVDVFNRQEDPRGRTVARHVPAGRAAVGVLRVEREAAARVCMDGPMPTRRPIREQPSRALRETSTGGAERIRARARRREARRRAGEAGRRGRAGGHVDARLACRRPAH
jgi:hypothetical protein